MTKRTFTATLKIVIDSDAPGIESAIAKQIESLCGVDYFVDDNLDTHSFTISIGAPGSRFERIQVPDGMTAGKALATFGAGMCAGGL